MILYLCTVACEVKTIAALFGVLHWSWRVFHSYHSPTFFQEAASVAHLDLTQDMQRCNCNLSPDNPNANCHTDQSSSKPSPTDSHAVCHPQNVHNCEPDHDDDDHHHLIVTVIVIVTIIAIMIVFIIAILLSISFTRLFFICCANII